MVKLTPKAARVLCGINQQEVADYIGTNSATLSNKETGKSQFKASEIEKFLRKLQLQEGKVDFSSSKCTKNENTDNAGNR